MIIKVLDKTNSEKLFEANQLAKKYDIDIPEDSIVILGMNDKEEIKSLIGLRNVLFVSPFISENHLIGKALYDYSLELIKGNNYSLIQTYAKKKNEKLYNKFGFNTVFEEYLIMEKLL